MPKSLRFSAKKMLVNKMRLDRYTNVSVPTVERKNFSCVAEAVAYFAKLGYTTNEFESTKDNRVMVSEHNPRDYVEIMRRGFLDINAIRHMAR